MPFPAFRTPIALALGAAMTTATLAAGMGASAGRSPVTPTTAPTSLSAAARPLLPATPPAAPRPTDTGRSPMAPDPHPPRGGLGPLGEPVGGRRLLSRGLVVARHAPALPGGVNARAWVLADLDTGAILAARDPHGRYPPASIQKLLTTITVLPLVPGDTKITVSRRAAQTEGSHAGLVDGGVYTADQIYRALLLVSGNDAAEALADAAGGPARTVARMNTVAMQLGGYDTVVQTPSGLDGWQQLTSAYDMTLFLRAAITQPRFLAYDRARTSTLPAQRIDGFARTKLYNQNTLFLQTVPGAMAAKTGYTDAAQHTFAGVIERGGHRYGVVLLRAQRWPLDQWQQAVKLVDWGRHLPRGTRPVGHLDAAVAPAAAARATSAPATPSPSASPAKKPKKSPKAVGLIVAVALIAAAFWITNWARNRRRRRPE